MKVKNNLSQTWSLIKMSVLIDTVTVAKYVTDYQPKKYRCHILSHTVLVKDILNILNKLNVGPLVASLTA